MSCKHENKGPLHIKNFRELKQQATPCNNNICEFVYNFSNNIKQKSLNLLFY